MTGRRGWLRPGCIILLTNVGTAAQAAPPLSYLSGFGAKAHPVVALTWGLLIISAVVTVVIAALLVAGIWLRRVRSEAPLQTVPIERRGSGLRWISVGVGVSSVALLASLIWTVVVLAKINGPPVPARLVIEVSGEQWWWKVRYLEADPARVLTTANELHIPAGQPVRVNLVGADVIHSFWVPALTGKTDTIPGQTNTTWLEASRPGVFLGQCTEYCGQQHAHMAFSVIADPPDKFAAWLDAQLRPAAPAAGQHAFEFHCGACHAVRGTAAGGTVAPDLTHLMSRRTLAAVTLPNTPGNLAGWIADPQQIKPGTLMPNLHLSGPDLSAVVAFLETLK